jgi:putative SbcD/Mre11-related phosphoesterase
MITPLSPYPAASIETEKTRTIVVADLHIGWEVALSKKGIHVPTQTPKLLGKLKALIQEFRPKRLLILGDVKHTVATAEMGEWHDIPDFFSDLRKRVQEICIIRGNHDGNLDPLLPEGIRLLPATGMVMGDVGFFHGHQWPSPTILEARTLVMGHIHPVVGLRDPAGFRISKQVWVKASCNKTKLAKVLLQKHNIKIEKSPEQTLLRHYRIKPRTQRLFIMPSFNDFLGGKPLNEMRLSGNVKSEMIAGPVLRSEAVDMEKAETYLLDGTFLGTLDQLRTLS